jgi:hypothetical protein
VRVFGIDGQILDKSCLVGRGSRRGRRRIVEVGELDVSHRRGQVLRHHVEGGTQDRGAVALVTPVLLEERQ